MRPGLHSEDPDGLTTDRYCRSGLELDDLDSSNTGRPTSQGEGDKSEEKAGMDRSQPIPFTFREVGASVADPGCPDVRAGRDYRRGVEIGRAHV